MKRSRRVGPSGPALPPITSSLPFNTAETRPKTSAESPLFLGTGGRHNHLAVCGSKQNHDNFSVVEFHVSIYSHSSKQPRVLLASTNPACYNAFFHAFDTDFNSRRYDLGSLARMRMAMSSGRPVSKGLVMAEELEAISTGNSDGIRLMECCMA